MGKVLTQEQVTVITRFESVKWEMTWIFCLINKHESSEVVCSYGAVAWH